VSLPRAIRDFSNHRGVIHYRRQAKPLKAWGLGPDYSIAITPSVDETHTIASERNGYTGGYSVTPEDLGLDERRLIEPMRTPLLREIGEHLREHGRLVEPSENPRYHVEIIVHVTGVVTSWPDVPGVTTPPWSPTGPGIAVPWSIDGKAWRGLRQAREKALYANAWEFSVLCNPEEEWLIADRDLVGNLCRVIPDERVPYGWLRPVERIG
jgi:hypothetical protein